MQEMEAKVNSFAIINNVMESWFEILIHASKCMYRTLSVK